MVDNPFRFRVHIFDTEIIEGYWDDLALKLRKYGSKDAIYQVFAAALANQSAVFYDDTQDELAVFQVDLLVDGIDGAELAW